MAKPIMSYEAVLAAARQVHLHGGVNPLAGRAEIQALATSYAKVCQYETTVGRPHHVDRLVCAIGAFFLVNDLTQVVIRRLDTEGPLKTARVGRWSGNVYEMITRTNLRDFVEVPAGDIDKIAGFQALHDRCFSAYEPSLVSDPDALMKFREAMGLEPA